MMTCPTFLQSLLLRRISASVTITILVTHNGLLTVYPLSNKLFNASIQLGRTRLLSDPKVSYIYKNGKDGIINEEKAKKGGNRRK